MSELIFSARKKDFRIERIRGSGPGGQHRNKTASCIRITHIESGMSEYCCESRNQHQNLRTAFKRLAKRLVDHYVGQDQKQRWAAGHDRVRTYHEPEDRVTDHRSGQKFSYRETIGRGDMEPLILASARNNIEDALTQPTKQQSPQGHSQS